MTIDWFPFIAQVVNFLILVWLMKKFLYGPIIAAMDARDAEIQARFTKAELVTQQADQVRIEYEKQLDELASNKVESMEDSRREVDEWRSQHLRLTRDEVNRQRVDWNDGLKRERQTVIRELQSMAVNQSVTLSRHVLKELTDTQLEDQAVHQFLDRLRKMESQSHAQESPGTAIVESAFPLSATNQSQISNVLDNQLSIGECHFRVNPELVCGVEVTLNGQRFGWSVRETLAELEQTFTDSVERNVPQLRQTVEDDSHRAY